MQTLVRTSQTENSTLPLDQSLRVVALGDSIVYGFGDPEGGGWVERLRRQWMQPESAGHVLYNLGVRGNKVHQVAHRLEHEFRSRGELRHALPDAIILSVGLNDSARTASPQGRPVTPIDEFEAEIQHLLQRARQLCPVVFVGMPPVDESKMPFAETLYYTQADQQQYIACTQAACRLHRIPYLNIFDLWRSRGEAWWQARLAADGLHPNVEGYRSLLEDFANWQAVAPWL